MRNFLTLFLLLLCIVSFSQEKEKYFGKTFAIGSSLTYMWDIGGTKHQGVHYFDEWAWNINASMKLSKKFWFGIQLNPIFTKEYYLGVVERNVYQFNGTFIQYDFLFKKGWRIYVETSLNYSDYCTCDTGLYYSPYRKSGLFFWGGGGGFEYVVNKNKGANLLVEFAFFNNVILNNINYRYNFTQYIIGLNYRFGKL